MGHLQCTGLKIGPPLSLLYAHLDLSCALFLNNSSFINGSQKRLGLSDFYLLNA